MKSVSRLITVLFVLVLWAGPLQAEDNTATDGIVTESAGEAPIEPDSAPLAPVPENTVAGCRDGMDNDLDDKVDCADEECQIFAICVGWVPPQPEPEPVAEPDPLAIPETGRLCRDNVDNNEDGLTDCHETTCQRYRYCRKQMYEVPEPADKAPGFFLNFGIGVALPNFRTPTATTRPTEPGRITWDNNVPFDPDIGVMGDIKAGYLPLKYLGAGIKFIGVLTGANNESKYTMSRDNPDIYKYRGSKTYTYVGGFIRLQWPFKRVVPYLDIAVGGYSVAKYKWNIYDGANSWDDIDDWERDEDNSLIGQKEKFTYESRHYTFALEPGVDIFVAKRKFAVGLKAWLPVIAVGSDNSYEDSSTDNIGVTINMTYTPMWRERPRLKAEYDYDIPPDEPEAEVEAAVEKEPEVEGEVAQKAEAKGEAKVEVKAEAKAKATFE